MKTIHISDGLWKRLKMAAAERGVMMREVIEEMGEEWYSPPVRPAVTAEETAALESAEKARKRALVLEVVERAKTGRPPELVKELTVEMED